jgi:hypothetical protein
MRLVGVELPGAMTGGDPAYVPIGAVSVLLGANDVGKSRALRCVAKGLAAVQMRAADAATPLPTFLVENAFAALLLDADDPGGAVTMLERASFFGRHRPLTRQDLGAARQAVRDRFPDEDPITHGVRTLAELGGVADSRWEPLLWELRASPYVLFRPCVARGVTGWQMLWCLPPISQLEEDAARLAGGQSLGRAFGTEEGPIPVAPLLPWLVNGRGLPSALVVPGAPGSLEADVAAALDRAVDLIPHLAPEGVVRGVLRGSTRRMHTRFGWPRRPSS